jgi:phage terminase large subunit GpA-like protein
MVEQLISIYASHRVAFNKRELGPSKWIEQNRNVQRHVSEKMFGQFDFGHTPYMRQIVDHLSPYDPVTHVVLMKGVRTGGTFAITHNGVPYVMSERPTNIMLLSANDTLATKTMQGVDSGIDGCKLRHLLGKGSGVQSNTKGDSMQQKFFSGGFELFNFGGQSASNMRQVTAGLIIADELDAFKGVAKDSGQFEDLMEDRARSFGDSKKIFYISSPKLLSSSLIYSLYLRGNQNVYQVPCPKCGAYVELVWNERNKNNVRYGVIFDVRNDEVIENSVRYRCGECEDEFFEKKNKREMLNNGFWKPSIEREDRYFVSYRVSALYAPTTMDNWYDFAKKWQLAHPRGGIKDQPRIQTFVNSILGMPFKPEGITLKTNKLQQNKREYQIGECPFELSVKDNNGPIMLITIACDLNGYEDDARIDYEIVAHSERGPTYSVDAGSVGTFTPKVEKQALAKEGVNVGAYEATREKWSYFFDVKFSVWTEFEKILEQAFGKNNKKANIVAVDIGHYQDHALEFVRRMNARSIFCVGVKGDDPEKFIMQSKTDIGNVYRSGSGDFYLLNVNIVKDWLAKYMEAGSYVDDNGKLRQDENFMNYPAYNKEIDKYTYRNYFAHFEAEHKIEKKTEGGINKYIWEKRRAQIQNHFWDVRVYNIFCKVFMTDLICSTSNPFKKMKYGTQTIKPMWVNACKLIKEAAEARGVSLS